VERGTHWDHLSLKVDPERFQVVAEENGGLTGPGHIESGNQLEKSIRYPHGIGNPYDMTLKGKLRE